MSYTLKQSGNSVAIFMDNHKITTIADSSIESATDWINNNIQNVEIVIG